MQEFLAFANELADASGPILRRYFRSFLTAETKHDASPVTSADKETEATLRAMIRERYPHHGFVGEESGSQSADGEYVWVIDPIDGTRNYLAGKPIFGTLIALIHNRAPLLGIIDCPATEERWEGWHGTGSVFNKRSISVDKPDKPLEECILSTTSPYLFAPEKKGAFERLRQATAQTVFGCDCYAYGLLASGHLDLVAESGLKTHDVMALIPVIEGAGGIVTDWRGEPIRFGAEETDVLAARSAEPHRAALATLNAV